SLAGLAGAPGERVEPAVERRLRVLEAFGHSGSRDAPVPLDPRAVVAGYHLPGRPADDGVGETRVTLEGRVDLAEAVIDGMSGPVHEDLEQAEGFVDRLEERAILALALPQRVLCAPARGDVARGAEPLDDGAVPVDDGYRTRQRPAKRAVGANDPVLE